MIIVSQDKSVIVNFNNIEAIEIGNVEENQCKGIIYARLVSNYFYKLGTYKTEERAKEVLQEIIQNIYPKSNVDMDIYGISFGVQSPVYEMPLE